MAYNRFEQTEEVQREELIRKIEATIKSMSLRELEALYYELSTKNYIILLQTKGPVKLLHKILLASCLYQA